MDLNEKDPGVTRALALALMRQAREYLGAIGLIGLADADDTSRLEWA
jgi:hypothetical protein